MNKKKNQHYVPQFYLKNFSVNSDRKTINLFNPKKELFVSGAPIKHQSSKTYFYGSDGVIEERLSQIENILAPKIEEIIKSSKIPKKYSDEHYALLIFMILNDLRNPTKFEQIKSFPKLANREIGNFSQMETENSIPKITHNEAIEYSLSDYEDLVQICSDLDYKLMINESGNPFFTCDFPSIKYNQFLEKKPIHGSITGYAARGLQLFLPLDSNRCLIFFDALIYKVGNRKEKLIKLSDEDVDQINVLQVLNCWQNVYFNDEVGESYVRYIYEKSKKFTKANQPTATSHGVIKGNEIKEDEQLIHFSNSDLLIKLSLSNVKFTRRANSMNLGFGFSPMRS